MTSYEAPPVVVDGLGMTYRAPVREAGLKAAFRSVVRRRFRDIDAVADLKFEVAGGEVIGFLGPNGAGKTSTMKMLAGVLHPTSGDAHVLGFVPWRRQREYLRQIALVRGSRPIGGPPELTVMDNLRYQRVLYSVTEDDFRRNLAELTDLLGLDTVLDRQVRALSLGERMRAALAIVLIYRPRVLFLDEPTIGLDVSAALMLRRLIADYAAHTGAAVLLTSHHMGDVESLCRRVILIDRGRIRYDGELAALAARLSPFKVVRLSLSGPTDLDWARFGDLEDGTVDGSVALRVPRAAVPEVTRELLDRAPVIDLVVEDPPLETVIDDFYRSESRA